MFLCSLHSPVLNMNARIFKHCQMECMPTQSESRFTHPKELGNAISAGIMSLTEQQRAGPSPSHCADSLTLLHAGKEKSPSHCPDSLTLLHAGKE